MAIYHRLAFASVVVGGIRRVTSNDPKLLINENISVFDVPVLNYSNFDEVLSYFSFCKCLNETGKYLAVFEDCFQL